MSRSDQRIGLNPWATKFVADKKREQYDTFETAWSGDYLLYKYTADDGVMTYEYMQAVPWSSGPCYFIALRWGDTDKKVARSLWKTREMEGG